MTVALMLLLLGAVVLIGGVAAGLVWLANTQNKAYSEQGEIVPGRSVGHPPEWAGAHSPEAKLHRRLVRAAAALRADQSALGGVDLDTRVTLEELALAIDRRLIQAAALPGEHRSAALSDIEAQVDSYETQVAEAVVASGAHLSSGLVLDAFSPDLNAEMISSPSQAEGQGEIAVRRGDEESTQNTAATNETRQAGPPDAH